MAIVKNIIALPAQAVIACIRLYQRTLSPDTGFVSFFFPHGVCKYYPTCSEYTKQAIQNHGLVRGTAKGTMRVIRCNPFSHGGYDPI